MPATRLDEVRLGRLGAASRGYREQIAITEPGDGVLQRKSVVMLCQSIAGLDWSFHISLLDGIVSGRN